MGASGEGGQDYADQLSTTGRADRTSEESLDCGPHSTSISCQLPAVGIREETMTTPTTPDIDNNVYNRLADTWWDEKGFLNILKAARNPWNVPYFQRILTQLWIDPKGKRALDVGCGGGLLAEEFARMGYPVTGIDPSDKSLEVARAHATHNGLHIDYRLRYGHELAFENETFEVVYCCDVFEHIQNWDAVIGEIERVLKPNGVFLYDIVNRTTLARFLDVAGVETDVLLSARSACVEDVHQA